MLRYLCLISFFLCISKINSLTYIKNLDYKNPTLKKIRKEVRYNLRATFSSSGKIKSLTCYFYIVQKKDNFFKIMAKTSLNFDTLISLNSLASPKDIYAGMKIKLCNMRGIYAEDKLFFSEKTIFFLSQKYKIPQKLIQYDTVEKKWFLVGKKLSKAEKGFFYGISFAQPLKTHHVSSKYGRRKDPFSNKITFHNGIDIAAQSGEPVFSAAKGKVIFAGTKGHYGNLVIVKHQFGYKTKYGHLSEIQVQVGQFLQKKQKIGLVGQTGRATGPHLHFEVKKYNKSKKPRFQTVK